MSCRVTRHRIAILAWHHAIDRAQHQRQPGVHEIDLRKTKRHVAGKDNALAQHVIDEIEQRGLVAAEDELGLRCLANGTNLSPPDVTTIRIARIEPVF
jgi:hypothetical protein